MINVKVMYQDETVLTQPLQDIDLLPKDNVLIILVEDTERVGNLKNVSMISGYDNYSLSQRQFNSQDWVMLSGWDEDDFIWRRVSECVGCPDRIVVDAPLGIMHVNFRGISVDKAAWDSAVIKFNEVL